MQVVANIIFLSTFYVSFTLGLALIFGVMRIANFAHGEFYMLGGYALSLTLGQLGGLPNAVVLVVAMVVAALLVGTLGALMQLALFRRLREQPFAIFMVTFGLSYALQVVVVKAVGPVGLSVPTMFPGALRIFGAVVPVQRLVVTVLTFAMIGALWLFLMHSSVGRAIRAVAQNRTGAVLQGININLMGTVTMFLGSALAAMSGVLMGSLLSITPFMGSDAIWRAFIIIIVGGLGSISGAVVAAFAFGALDTLLVAFGLGHLVALSDALIMLLVLAFRPSGILGAKE